MNVLDIKKILKEKSNKDYAEKMRKYIPTKDKIYGVKMETINEIVRKCKDSDFNLVLDLWKDGFLEEKILGAKIFGKISKRDIKKSFKVLKVITKYLSDWASCDTLATQGVRYLAKKSPKDLFEFIVGLKKKNVWVKRFSIVVSIELYRQGFREKRLKKFVKEFESEEQYYIKKAFEWAKRVMN